jgi:hypothetical protein
VTCFFLFLLRSLQLQCCCHIHSHHTVHVRGLAIQALVLRSSRTLRGLRAHPKLHPGPEDRSLSCRPAPCAHPPYSHTRRLSPYRCCEASSTCPRPILGRRWGQVWGYDMEHYLVYFWRRDSGWVVEDQASELGSKHSFIVMLAVLQCDQTMASLTRRKRRQPLSPPAPGR